MEVTCDPSVVIEERAVNLTRYHRFTDGRRWEVLGECVYRGDGVGPCTEGDAGPILGPPGFRLDVPMTPEAQCSLCIDGGHVRFNELPPSRGRVIVPALTDDCPAARALRMENLYPEVWIVGQSVYAYGELLQRVWRGGEGFVLVEHDVVPWPGAIAALWDCDERWCGYCYLLGQGQLGGGIGCVHFGGGLVRAYPNLADDWHSVPWYALDGHVNAAMRVIGLEDYHVHRPAVGHAPVYATG